MASVKQQKQALRADLKEKRLSISDAQRTIMSRQIVEHLNKSVDWSRVNSLHYYEPIKQLLEPDISPLIVELEDTYPDLKLFTPRLIGDKWELVAVRGGDPPDQFDVILVPMLGFDENLNRIGYGGGYYDKFLATQPKAQIIGVCYESGKVSLIPNEIHDIAVTTIITDFNTYA